MSGKLHAVLVANGTFPDDPTHLRNLKCPTHDVAALAEILKSEAHGGYLVTTIVDGTHDMAERTIYQCLKKAQPDDLVLLFFSGHGKLDEDGNLYLATKDTVADALPPSAIALDDIRKYLAESRASRKVVILDCCFSGAIKKLYKGEISDQATQAIRDFEGQGTFYLSASTDVQLAEEKEADEYSLLTKHILAGIKDGRADSNDDGKVTFQELCAYVQAEVPREGSQKPKAWFLEAEGDVTVALTGKPACDARRKAIARKLYELGNQDLVTDDAVAKVLQIINRDLEARVTANLTVRQLIDSLHGKLGSRSLFLQEVVHRTRPEVSDAYPGDVQQGYGRKHATNTWQSWPKVMRYVSQSIVGMGIALALVVLGRSIMLEKRSHSLQAPQTQAAASQKPAGSPPAEAGSSLRPPQSSQQPAELAKAPATPVSDTKKRTESRQHKDGLSPRVPKPANTMLPTDNASALTSQAGGNFGSVRQTPAVTQSAHPEIVSNPSADGDAKVGVVQEAFKQKDWEKVVSLSRELANAGDPRGMYYLGRLYTLGAGVPKSWELEKYWYEKSAAGGYCYAMYMLGISYNANFDSEHAREWWMKGAAAQPPECAAMCAKRLQRP